MLSTGFPPPTPQVSADIVNQLLDSLWWIGNHTLLVIDDSGREFVDVPWLGNTQLFTLPSGGFGVYVVPRDHLESVDPASGELWTSADGRSWVNHGTPEFGSEGFEEIQFLDFAGERLLMALHTSSGTTRYRATEDGLVWTETPDPFGSRVHIDWTPMGYLATSVPTFDQPKFWHSFDGDEWEELESPHGASIEGSQWGVADDMLWLTTLTDESERTLWVGQFGDD